MKILRLLAITSTCALSCHSVLADQVLQFPLSRESSVVMVKKLLSDPRLTAEAKHTFLLEQKDPNKRWRDYSIATDPQGNKPVGRVAFFDRPAGYTDFSINLDASHTESADGEPNWDDVQRGWDQFVSSYWPTARRIDNWSDQIYRYNSSGNFSINYVTEYKGVESARINLTVRLGDGKIDGINITDYSIYLKGVAVPNPPEQSQIIKAFQTSMANAAASRKPASIEKAPTITAIKSLRRGVGVRISSPDALKPPGGIDFVNTVTLLAKNQQGEDILIGGEYSEKAKTALIQWSYPQKEIEEMKTRSMPFTQAMDTEPRWSRDGKGLYFVTSRDWATRPRWNRGVILDVPSLARYDDETKVLNIVRPFKFKRDNYSAYALPLPSPSEASLLLKGPAMNDDFVALDMKRGTASVAQGQRTWDMVISRSSPTGNSVFVGRVADAPAEIRDRVARTWDTLKAQGYGWHNWNITGGDWLSDESGVVVTLEDGWPNLVLLKRDTTGPQPSWNVHYIDSEGGPNILPTLSDSSHTLSWVNGTPPKRGQSKPAVPDTEDSSDTEMQWKFVTALFDANTGKATGAAVLPLTFHPVSLSYDPTKSRWLIVADNGAMFWIRHENNQLKMEKTAELTWKGEVLHPLSASVSPTDGTIAVAAQLAQPKTFSASEVTVFSTIFRWDASKNEVEPFFDPSLNRLTPYVFPQSKSPWVKFEGPLPDDALAQQIETSP